MTSEALALQVERRIYLIRAEKVMLDYDLAALYGVPTKSLNLAVKRFHFETSKSRRGGRRYYFFANISISERNEGCYSGERTRPRVLFTTPSSRTPPGAKSRTAALSFPGDWRGHQSQHPRARALPRNPRPYFVYSNQSAK